MRTRPRRGEGSSDAPPWSVGCSGWMQKSIALERFRSFLDMECTVQQQGGGWEVNVSRREDLKAAISLGILMGAEGADKEERVAAWRYDFLRQARRDKVRVRERPRARFMLLMRAHKPFHDSLNTATIPCMFPAPK